MGIVGAVGIVGVVGYKLAPEGEMRVQATSLHQRGVGAVATSSQQRGVGAVATSSQQRGRAFAKRPYITYYKSC